MKVGFIGLGRMGQGMASRILGAGHDLRVHDAFPGQTTALEEDGAMAAESPAAACAGREIVISSLPHDEALAEILRGEEGLLASMPANCVHMAMGTHGVSAIKSATRGHQKSRQQFVHCPVLGRPDLAAQGALGLVPAGEPAAVNVARPLFGILGKQTFEAGPDPQAAAAVKIANNFLLGCAIENMGEAFSLVEKMGVEPQLFFEVMVKGLFGAPAYEVYGRFIVEETWESHGATALIGRKDADLTLEAGAEAGVPMPSTHVWREHLQAAIDNGEGALDWAVMAKVQARASGLKK